jgi:hypothetical protein
LHPSLFWPWLYAFVFTQVVEIPIYRRPLGGRTLVAFGASAITHPIVWFVFPALPWFRGYWPMIAAAELFAWVVEAFYVYGFGVRGLRRAFLWSLAANGASFSLGLLSHALFGRP